MVAARTDAPGVSVDVGEVVEQAERQLRALDRADLAARVHEELRRLRRPTSDVLVVGEFKKGKSALVNALLNGRISPADPDRFTAAPVVVHHGRRLRAHALLGDPPAEDDEHAFDPLDGSAGRDVDLAELTELVTDVGEPSPPAVRSVVVEMPRRLLEEGLVLVDTPGVGGGLSSRHATRTLRALALASAVVFVTDASQELTAPEVDLLEQVRRLCPTVVCVCTKVDVYAEWRRILELDVGHLAARGLPTTVLPLASPLRHRAVRTGDEVLDRASGYPALVAWLHSEVLGREDDLRARAAAASVVDALGHVATEIEERLAIARDPDVTARAAERLTRARAEIARIRAATESWRTMLGNRYEDLAVGLDADRTLRMRRLRDEVTARVGDSDVVTEWEALEAWVRRRANEELVGHFAEMRARADGVAREVLARFDLDLDGVDLYENLDVPDGGEVPDQIRRPRLEEMTRSQALFAAVRGSSGGVVALSTATTIAGPLGATGALALASGAGAVVGAGVAAVFGRRAVAAAREAEARVHRADATRALVRHLEQVEVIARMDSLRMLKRVRDRLASYLDGRAREARRTAERRREATAEAMTRDQAELTRRIAGLESTLAAITEIAEAAALVLEVTVSAGVVEP